MRRIIAFYITGFCLLVPSSFAQSPPSPENPPIPLQLNGATKDDALVALAQAAHVNFLADATHFDKAPITLDSTGTLERHLAELDTNSDNSHKLTWLPKGQVLLFWTAPDLRQLVQETLAGQSIKLAQPEALYAGPVAPKTTTPLNRKTPTPKLPSQEELLFKEVSDYFQEQQGWKNKTSGDVREVKISDLPTPLRTQVIAIVQRKILRTDSVAIWQAWFNDAFWNNAQLKVMEESNGHPYDPKIPVLTVGGEIRTKTFIGGSMISLGALKEQNN